MKPETERWLLAADEDIDVADAAFERSRHPSCVFHCQQALEKALKGLWTERSDGSLPPRTHNLARLAELLALDLSSEQDELLNDLSYQYLPSRYPEVGAAYTSESSAGYLRLSKEFLQWLRQQMN